MATRIISTITDRADLCFRRAMAAKFYGRTVSRSPLAPYSIYEPAVQLRSPRNRSAGSFVPRPLPAQRGPGRQSPTIEEIDGHAATEPGQLDCCAEATYRWLTFSAPLGEDQALQAGHRIRR
jgi:hypothetical protein